MFDLKKSVIKLKIDFLSFNQLSNFKHTYEALVLPAPFWGHYNIPHF